MLLLLCLSLLRTHTSRVIAEGPVSAGGVNHRCSCVNLPLKDACSMIPIHGSFEAFRSSILLQLPRDSRGHCCPPQAPLNSSSDCANASLASQMVALSSNIASRAMLGNDTPRIAVFAPRLRSRCLTFGSAILNDLSMRSISNPRIWRCRGLSRKRTSGNAMAN